MIALSVIPAWVLGPGNMLPAWEGKRMIAFSLSNLMLVDTIAALLAAYYGLLVFTL